MTLDKRDEIQHHVNIFLDEILEGQNDYSCVLLGVSIIDEHLKILLEKYFINSKTTERILDKGFAGNLRARADLSYVLGLIDKTDYKNLITILEIRNKFGHNFKILTFSSEEISELCGKLVVNTERGEDEDSETWNGYKFRYALVDLISGISYQTQVIEKSKFKEVKEIDLEDIMLAHYEIQN